MLKIEIEKRPQENNFFKIRILALFLALGLLSACLIFTFNGINPFFALSKIFVSSFGSLYGLGETITKSIPLILIGLGLAIAFKGKFLNIGAEGQLLAGSILAVWVGLSLGEKLPPFIIIPLMFLAGFLGGALWGLFPAFAKVKFNTNEIITTLMMNYIAEELVKYLIYGPWKGKTQFGFPYTDHLSDWAILPVISGTRIHYPTLIIAITAVIVVSILINKMKTGYEIKVIGGNPDAARYAGINIMKNTLFLMIISGGLAGIAGVGEVAGIHHHLTYPWSISSGYGYTAIIVAYLAMLNPVGVIFSAIFLGGILVGGDAITTSLGLPFNTINIFNGLILQFLIISEFFISYRLKIKK